MNQLIIILPAILLLLFGINRYFLHPNNNNTIGKSVAAAITRSRISNLEDPNFDPRGDCMQECFEEYPNLNFDGNCDIRCTSPYKPELRYAFWSNDEKCGDMARFTKFVSGKDTLDTVKDACTFHTDSSARECKFKIGSGGKIERPTSKRTDLDLTDPAPGCIKKLRVYWDCIGDGTDPQHGVCPADKDVYRHPIQRSENTDTNIDPWKNNPVFSEKKGTGSCMQHCYEEMRDVNIKPGDDSKPTHITKRGDCKIQCPNPTDTLEIKLGLWGNEWECKRKSERNFLGMYTWKTTEPRGNREAPVTTLGQIRKICAWNTDKCKFYIQPGGRLTNGRDGKTIGNLGDPSEDCAKALRVYYNCRTTGGTIGRCTAD